MNDDELAEYAKVRQAALTMADAIVTNDPAKWNQVKEFNFSQAYNIIYQIAMRPLPSNSSQANLYGTGEELYLKFQQLLAELVRRHPIDSSLQSEELFRTVITKWTQFQFIERWMLKAFQYISRFYVPHLSKPPLSFLSLVIFNQEVFKKHEKTVNSVLLSDIQRLRAGDNVDQERMKNAVRLLLKMGFGDRMSQEFVRDLLAATASYYRDESKRCVASHSVVDYVRKVYSWLTSEAQLASWVLPDNASMQQEFLGEVEKEAIAAHLPFILDSQEGGFVNLLRQNRLADLKFLLQIMIRPQANGIHHMARLFKQECLEDGEKIITKHSFDSAAAAAASATSASEQQKSVLVKDPDAKSYVTEFIALHEKYMDLVQHCLSHSSFSLSVKEAFEATINQGVVGPPVYVMSHYNSSNTSSEQQQQQQQQPEMIQQSNTISSSELIARYSDAILRGGSANPMSDHEFEATINKIVSLFTRIHDKDDFFDCIRNTLSRRLLSNSANEDRERTLLSKFRAKCGSTATNKLEGMLHDIDGSRSLLTSYANSSERRELEARCGFSQRGCDFSPLLLTAAFWPTMGDESLVPPSAVGQHMKAFEKHYCTGKHHRQLKWVYAYGNAAVGVSSNLMNPVPSPTAPGSPASFSCELIVNLYQSAVICCFNTKVSFTVEEIAEMTGLSLEEVSRHIHSFASNKVGALLKIANNEGGGIKIPLDPKQEITLNDKFTAPSKKVKVPALIPKTASALALAAASGSTASLMMQAAGSSSSMMMVMNSKDGTTAMGGGGMPRSNTNDNNNNTSSATGAAGGSSSTSSGPGILGPTTNNESHRTAVVEATIMKVMKSRKSMNHPSLMSSVMEHLQQRFKPDVSFIKKCIERLLERELISRDPQDPNVYLFQTSQ